ncbi:MAG: rod shape-determining protein RodA [Vicinamibacterales bacterium]
MFERRLSSHLDWPLLVAVLALTAIGVAMIFSTTGGASREYWTQIYAIGLGLGAMVVCLSVDYRSLVDKAHWIYLALLVALLGVLLFGAVRGGSRRWLDLGVFNLQPSEFVKAGVALVLAKLLGESRRAELSNQDLFLATVLTLVPLVLIARQPDLGTAVTLLPVLGAVVFAAGLSMRYLAIGAVVALVLAPIAWSFALEDYQKSRIVTFLDPEQDPRGAGYQQIQARITVGSGGVLGKGFRQGTQGQLRFLPVAHNDFIFSVLAEEQGFAGVVVALALYLFVIMRSLDAARLSKDRVGTFVVLGVLASFTFQVVYNISMSAGLAPVKGLTLPLMSYGGSSMIATLAGFGLILGVKMRRFTN